MDSITVSVAQLAPKLGDKQYNYEQIKKTILDAKQEKSRLVVFPELFLSGYSVGNQLEELAETIDGPYMKKIKELCRKHEINTIISYPEDGGNGTYYISSSFIDEQGDVLGTYRKVHLFDAEKNYFTAGSSFEVIDTPLGSIGMMICFDVEFPEIARALALRNVDFIVIVNANMHPYETHHHIYARSRAMENETPVIICNRLGQEDDLNFCGDSMLIDAHGEILLSLKDREQVKSVELPIKQSLDPKMNYINGRRIDLYEELVK